MIKLPVETPTATLRYALTPDEAGVAAIEATFAAYDRMMAILTEVAPVGANLVSLHAQAYETIRRETDLPARLVTLGLRDRAGYMPGAMPRKIPLDDKLFAIKGPTSLTISTVRGRVLVPFDVPGYLAGWDSPFPAHLVSDGQAYEVHIAVKSKSTQPEEKTMLHEGILARMGRLLAAIASQTIDNAENNNKVALVKQAIREIDSGADEARHALGKSRAEEFRLKRRRDELDGEAASLTEKIRLALAENREDLARAGVARQIDLESQGIALDAMDFIDGVGVSCLCPMGVNTDLLHGSGGAGNVVKAAGTVLEPADVAEVVVAGLETETFLILPHPEVLEFFRRKGADYDRWLAGMRRLQASVAAQRDA